jgi:hypothetical protein
LGGRADKRSDQFSFIPLQITADYTGSGVCYVLIRILPPPPKGRPRGGQIGAMNNQFIFSLFFEKNREFAFDGLVNY